MGWLTKSTGSEMGDYLPDDEATLKNDQVSVQGKNENEAQKACEEEASKYDAVEAHVEPTESANDWTCKFKFWG